MSSLWWLYAACKFKDYYASTTSSSGIDDQYYDDLSYWFPPTQKAMLNFLNYEWSRGVWDVFLSELLNFS